MNRHARWNGMTLHKFSHDAAVSPIACVNINTSLRTFFSKQLTAVDKCVENGRLTFMDSQAVMITDKPVEEHVKSVLGTPICNSVDDDGKEYEVWKVMADKFTCIGSADE